MAGEPRYVAGRPMADQRSIRLLLTRLDLREDIANQMPRQALVSLVKQRGVHLADRAQLEYVYGSGVANAPRSPTVAGVVDQTVVPPPRPPESPAAGEAEAPVVDYRRAAGEAAREAVRQMEEPGQRPAPRPWWWRLWPPNWREESS